MKRLLFLLLLVSAMLQGGAHALDLDLGNGVYMEMILVPRGSFEQGSPGNEAGREEDEGPQRSVRITEPFYMGKHPVTVAQFEQFVKATKYRTEAEKGESGGFGVVSGKLLQLREFTWKNPGYAQTGNHPVGMISAQDAAAFCQWLGKQVRRDCTLPTEAQWEYACRAGSPLARYQEPVDAIAWHRANSAGVANAVGLKKPNAWGFHDMHGPVWQWCRDWYAPYPDGPATNPVQTNQNLSDKPRRVLRGGSFLSDVSRARSAERYRNDAHSRNADNGFRVVCGVQEIKLPAPMETRGAGTGAGGAAGENDAAPEEPGAGMMLLGWSAVIFAFTVPILVAFFFVRGVIRLFSGGKSGPPPLPGRSLTGPEAAAMMAARPDALAAGYRFGFTLKDDGFFITGPPDAAGQRLRYECTTNGRTIADDLVFTPGPEGHYVFTGRRPSSVSVQTLGGAAGTESDFTYGSNTTNDDDPHRNSFRSSGSSSRWPSAY